MMAYVDLTYDNCVLGTFNDSFIFSTPLRPPGIMGRVVGIHSRFVSGAVNAKGFTLHWLKRLINRTRRGAEIVMQAKQR